MKILTEEEFLNLSVKGRGRASQFFTAILNLKTGQCLLINKSEWKRRTTPARISHYIGKRYDRKFYSASLEDDSGWVVKRIS